jgi:hypothetical protein
MNRKCALLIITDKILFCGILFALITNVNLKNKDVLILPVEKCSNTLHLTERIMKDLHTSSQRTSISS